MNVKQIREFFGEFKAGQYLILNRHFCCLAAGLKNETICRKNEINYKIWRLLFTVVREGLFESGLST